MAESPSYLAIDMGASSGRAVVGTLDGTHMDTREVHRFRTPLMEEGGHLYWDHEVLWNEVLIGLANALEVAPDLRSISVDSWAVDYICLDQNGKPLRRPYAYRDTRTKGKLSELLKQMSADGLYALTGIQFLEFNTLVQVLTDLQEEPDIVELTATRLLIADYLLYRLSGELIAERTMASTTQLMNVHSGNWAEDLIRATGDNPARWPRIVPSGTVLGNVRFELLPTGITQAPVVIATCSHDTASAIAAVPALEDQAWAYISSGTWSLVGAELHTPVLIPQARDAGFTNEAGLDGTIRFLKNRTGMWVLEESMREWSEAGEAISYDKLLSDAADLSISGAIDLNTPELGERGEMQAKIEAACSANGISIPASRGGLVRLVLQSLAQSYRETLDELETLTHQQFKTIYIVGGGSRNALLNQLAADACGRRVVAGPAEATVLGNLLVQARAMGDLPRDVSIRDAARFSSQITEYIPHHVDD